MNGPPPPNDDAGGTPPPHRPPIDGHDGVGVLMHELRRQNGIVNVDFFQLAREHAEHHVHERMPHVLQPRPRSDAHPPGAPAPEAPAAPRASAQPGAQSESSGQPGSNAEPGLSAGLSAGPQPITVQPSVVQPAVVQTSVVQPGSGGPGAEPAVSSSDAGPQSEPRPVPGGRASFWGTRNTQAGRPGSNPFTNEGAAGTDEGPGHIAGFLRRIFDRRERNNDAHSDVRHSDPGTTGPAPHANRGDRGDDHRFDTSRFPAFPHRTVYFISIREDEMAAKASDRALESLRRVPLAEVPVDERMCTICYEPLTDYRPPEPSAAHVEPRSPAAGPDADAMTDSIAEPAAAPAAAPAAPAGEPAGEQQTPAGQASAHENAEEEAEEDHSALALPQCKHIFGASCLRAWLKSASSCPLCRTRLESEADARHMRFPRFTRRMPFFVGRDANVSFQTDSNSGSGDESMDASPTSTRYGTPLAGLHSGPHGGLHAPHGEARGDTPGEAHGETQSEARAEPHGAESTGEPQSEPQSENGGDPSSDTGTFSDFEREMGAMLSNLPGNVHSVVHSDTSENRNLALVHLIEAILQHASTGSGDGNDEAPQQLGSPFIRQLIRLPQMQGPTLAELRRMQSDAMYEALERSGMRAGMSETPLMPRHPATAAERAAPDGTPVDPATDASIRSLPQATFTFHIETMPGEEPLFFSQPPEDAPQPPQAPQTQPETGEPQAPQAAQAAQAPQAAQGQEPAAPQEAQAQGPQGPQAQGPQAQGPQIDAHSGDIPESDLEAEPIPEGPGAGEEPYRTGPTRRRAPRRHPYTRN